MAEVEGHACSAGASVGSKMEASTNDSMLLSMDDFKQFKQIGKGKDCVVYSAVCDKLKGASVVLKVYDKAKISAIKHRSVRREARIMRYLTEKGVPHTTAYTGAFQDSKQIYIVMELCSGGDLLEQLLREGRAMAEKRVVREIVLPTLTALCYLHAAGIIHRDIKLENLFISSSGHLQLGDFGLAISTQEERAISPVGTLEYMPPEILRLPSTDLVVKGLVNVDDITPVDEKVDVWSFGVTVYELVTGRSPFEGASKDEIKQAILGYRMRPLPAFLTPGCQDFILQAMCPRAEDRPGAYDLLKHPWVQLHCTASDLVAVARLPMQVPRVPMGYRSSSNKQRSNGKQAAVPAVGASEVNSSQNSSSTAAVGTADDAAAVSSAAVQAGGPMLAKVKQECGTPSSPSSPQIPAFMPGATTSMSQSRASRESGAVGDLPRSGSCCSGHSQAPSMADSAASLYQPAGRCSDGNCEQTWAGSRQQQQQLSPAHEPIYESPSGELLAMADLQQKQQQQLQQQQQQSQLGKQQVGDEMLSPRSKKMGGNKLFKWICMTPGAQGNNSH